MNFFKVKDLQGEVSGLQAKLKAAEEAKVAAEENAATIAEQAQKLKDENAALLSEKASLTSQISELNSKLATANSELTTAKAAVADFDGKVKAKVETEAAAKAKDIVAGIGLKAPLTNKPAENPASEQPKAKSYKEVWARNFITS